MDSFPGVNSTLRQGVRAGRQGDFLQTTDVRFPGKHTAMGWEVVPAGLSEGVVRLHKATQAGAPLRGYFAWSPMDTFEWSHGQAKRFGFLHVGYTAQRRIIKQSGRWYG